MSLRMMRLLVAFGLFLACHSLTLPWRIPELFKQRPEWDSLRVKWGLNLFNENNFRSLPRRESDAHDARFVLLSDECREIEQARGQERRSRAKFLGKRYWKIHDPSVVLIYDVNGYIAGIQAAVPKHALENENDQMKRMGVQMREHEKGDGEKMPGGISRRRRQAEEEETLMETSRTTQPPSTTARRPTTTRPPAPTTRPPAPTTRPPAVTSPSTQEPGDHGSLMELKRPLHYPYVEDGDVIFFTIYFIEPERICSRENARFVDDFEHWGTGSGLYIQNGTNARSFLRIPRDEVELHREHWKPEKCFWTLGRIFSYNFHDDQDCQSQFPLLLNFNHGKLTGFSLFWKLDFSSCNLEHPDKGLLRFMFEKVPKCYYDIGRLTKLQFFFTNDYLSHQC